MFSSEKEMSEDSLKQAEMRYVASEMEQVLYYKRLEELLKPGQVYTADELSELIEVMGKISTHAAAKAAMLGIAEKALTQGLTPTFGATAAGIIIKQEARASSRHQVTKLIKIAIASFVGGLFGMLLGMLVGQTMLYPEQTSPQDHAELTLR